MENRKTSIMFLWTIGILFGMLGFFASNIGDAKADSNMNFSQKILPVNFVYLNKKGDIGSVWSNVSASDDLYVVKFFDEKKHEVPLSQNLLRQFAKKSESMTSSMSVSEHVQFVQKGSVLQEIKTLV